ncbi:MAG: glycosyltransferase family 4 protein [Polaromonas sp.]|uniref:glycosyltransferase family 4 protein n=1 Tax=Polaromonas sp. TaxID=1869339 RepID=UPI0032660740
MSQFTAPAPPRPIHFVGYFDDPYAGAELELVALAGLLSPLRPAQLWSVVPPHRHYAAQGVKAIQPFAGQFPKDGDLCWGGAHVPPAVWLKYARFGRVILHCNLASYERLFSLIEILRDTTLLEPELIFASQALRLTAGLPGRVGYSLMDLEPFLQVGRARSISPVNSLTVGRVSRDTPDKHHPQDPDLYRMLAANGWHVRVMGGTCLANQLQGVEGVELLPSGVEAVADFLRTLDVFFYRTGSTVEAYGRVVPEAMASGLPVVAGRLGGYAEIMIPGETGLLVGSQEEAWNALEQLAGNPPLRHAMGQAAMHQAERLHGDAAIATALSAYQAAATSGRPRPL